MEKDLIQDWANILFENNRDIDRLNDCPLIPEEMDEAPGADQGTAHTSRLEWFYQWQDSIFDP